MYLKSIEVQGFKSFANKLNFEFQEGITAIVGPNGSGKSNVADAVRWVLGEQSAKQLRSGNMQDVIFAGTETRKPMGFAYVSITFDNSDHVLDVDYEEVKVTRRLYRSGESEYLINNAQVRLKDIHEIFYDTGIGQEGYSIIGQGQIDRILSGKSEERRELFDEAAGIVKFKKRKNETLKKLDGEHQNLLRVNDILSELEGRIGPLRKESEKAHAYLDKKQELKELDVNMFQIDEGRVSKELKDLSEKLDIAENDMRESREAFDLTKKEYEEIEERLTGIDGSIGDITAKISEGAVLREQMKSRIELTREQIRALEAAGKQYEERLKSIAASLDIRKGDIEKAESELKEAGTSYEKVSAEEEQESRVLSSLDEKISETVRGIDRAKNDVIDVLNARAAVRGNSQKYGTMLEQLEIRRSGIGNRMLHLKEEETGAGEELEKNRQAIKERTRKMEELSAKQAEYEQSLAGIRESMGTAHDRLDEVTAQYHRDSSRLDSLRAMAENYDGYGNGIRRVMEQKRRNPGIRGVVADLIDVPKEYETAISTALGGSIRNIVTDNEATAKYLIEYLKSNRYGRATFLPLTSIRGRHFQNKEALSETGVVGIASDLVECEEDYAELRDYLLGRILVVDNIDHAIAIGRAYRHSIYMVTLAGESFAPGGSITGGAFKNTDNLLGRKREIDELGKSTKALRKKAEELQNAIDSGKAERNRIRDDSAANSDAIQKLKIELSTYRMAEKQAEEQLQLAGINTRALEQENDEILRQIADVKSKSGGIEESLRESETKESEASKREEELRKREAELRDERAKEAARLEEIHVRSVSLGQAMEFRKENLARLKSEAEALKAEDAEVRNGIGTSGKDVEDKKQDILDTEKKVRESEDAEAADTKRKAELEEEKQKLSQSHRAFFEKRDQLSEHMSRLDREIFRLNSQKEKLESGREEQAAYMFEEYNLTPSEIRTIRLPEMREDRAGLKKDISAAKDFIKKLGVVNVNAIEEYKNVSERYEFLNGQHEDLVKSEETLTGIIAELDAGMRRQFSEKFAEIRLEFDKSFRELFGGGHGTLELDPDADILEAGISVIAHPPGKKLQNMMQLSGGEKALTAIALLFAIQNLKPSPFCLLDEIEAALDESNVGRFAAYLHKLTKNTQFIIITHRRGTMTAADRLYGITMQEKGVSTLVSVSLIEDKLDN